MDNQAIQSATKVWSVYVRARRALLAKGYVRSFKQPEADFSEWLVANLLGGELSSSKSHPQYDVIAGDKRIQVKSLAKAAENKNGYIIKDKDRDNDPHTGATHYAFVFFDELLPSAVFLAPADFVRNFEKAQIRRSDLEQTGYRIAIDLHAFNTEST